MLGVTFIINKLCRQRHVCLHATNKRRLVFLQSLSGETWFIHNVSRHTLITFFLLWHYPNLPCESSLFSQQLYRLPAELGFKSSETNESCSAWSIGSISALIHAKPFWLKTLETRKMIIPAAAAAIKNQKSIFSSSRVPEIKFWKFYPASSPGLHILLFRLKKSCGYWLPIIILTVIPTFIRFSFYYFYCYSFSYHYDGISFLLSYWTVQKKKNEMASKD